MKPLKFFLLSMVYLVFVTCNQESNKKGDDIMNTKDQEDIFKETESFIEAWNKADPKAAASFYTEDGVRVGAMGDIEHGREEITVAYDNLMHKIMPDAKAKQEKGTIRMLTSELALWQAGLEIEKPDGSPPMKGYVIQVMKKVQGRWLILESHPKIFPQPK